MAKHSANYYAGIDTRHITSRISTVSRDLPEVDTQLAVARLIFPGTDYLTYVDGPFMMYDMSAGTEQHPLSIRGHQIEIQSPNPKTVRNAKALEFGLGLLGPHYNIVNITPEGDASELIGYAQEGLPEGEFELEYRLLTQPDFHTSPLIVAHHRHNDQMNPLAEVRRGRFLLVDGKGETIETIAGTESEADAVRIMESYVSHGILYGVTTVSPEEELKQLWHSHHHKGKSLFRSASLF